MSRSHTPGHLEAEGLPVAVPPFPGFQQVSMLKRGWGWSPCPQRDLQALQLHCHAPFHRQEGNSGPYHAEPAASQ